MAQPLTRPGAAAFDRMDGNITYLLTTIAKQIENEIPDLLQGTDLNTTGYRILKSVQAYDDLSISDLGRIMQIDRAQISRAAVALAGQGYVSFHDHPGNKRKKMVSLTPRGVEVLALVAPRFDARRARIEAALGPRLGDTLAALHIVRDALPR
ncbi:MarR family winged helix-turn-helix transcriptional regulator [Pseudaestuariivita atlantica]|uniref:MarR family winged helix-turn-helix transcriptional regulator n=1 Tax=Pseudaestuariivita atlantica TaxID=1317121 RepID=UPI00067B343E|nr:MarR family transcriptional regulator [Pseudaestuariivita atlantica]